MEPEGICCVPYWFPHRTGHRWLALYFVVGVPGSLYFWRETRKTKQDESESSHSILRGAFFDFTETGGYLF